LYLPRLAGFRQISEADIDQRVVCEAAGRVLDAIERKKLVPGKLKYGKNSFDAYVTRMLKNAMIDAARRRERLKPLGGCSLAGEAPPSLRVMLAADALVDRFRRVRRRLDTLRDVAEGFFPVVLLRLRLGFVYKTDADLEGYEIPRLAMAPTTEGSMASPPVLGTIADAAEYYFQWSDDEQAMPVRHGYPQLRHVWHELAQVERRDDLRPRLLAILPLEKGTWLKWKERSSKAVRQRVGGDEWSELFGTLLSVRAL
jgi:hypothetical protein